MISFDNATNLGNNGGSGDLTAPHISAGSDGLLLVWTYSSTGGVTGTYNGVAMNTSATFTQSSANYGVLQLLWLLAPATGSHNVVISPGSQQCDAIAVSYAGVLQSGFPDSTAKQDPTTPTSPITTSVTTVLDNTWVAAGTLSAPTVTLSAGTNQTQRSTASSVFKGMAGDTNAAQTPAGSKSIATNFDDSPGDVAMLVVSFAPSASVATGGGFLLNYV